MAPCPRSQSTPGASPRFAAMWSIPPAAQHSWILGDEAPSRIGVAQRERRENVVPSPARHEKVRDGTMRRVLRAIPTGRPADDSQLVIVALSNDVAARIREMPDDIDVTRGRCPVHRVSVVTTLADVRVDAALEQEVDGRELPVLRRRVEKRPLVRRLAQMQPLRMRVEQGA